MINPMPYINDAWAQASPAVRRLLAAIALVLLVPFAITFGLQAWRDSRIQSLVDGLVTTDDLNKQTSQIQNYKTQAVDSIVNDAIASYDLLIRQYLADERRMAIDTAFVPLLRQVKILTDAVIQQQRFAKQTDTRVKELPEQFDEKLNRMLEASNPTETVDKLDEVMQALNELKEEQAAIREELKGRKVQKQRF